MTKKNKESDLSYMKDDRTLKKVEKYVNSKREQTSKEIIERKSKRPATKYQEADIEVMISRISSETKPKGSTKKISKGVVYAIYLIIMIIVIIFCMKYFFNGNLPQIS